MARKHAGASISRYSVGSDGLAPYRRARGNRFDKEVSEFGESVWYLLPKSAGRNKIKSRGMSGNWLGIREESGEVIVGTDRGVIKVGIVRRKGSNADRCDLAQLDSIKGSPWEPQLGVDSIEIYAKIKVRSEEGRERESVRLPNWKKW